MKKTKQKKRRGRQNKQIFQVIWTRILTRVVETRRRKIECASSIVHDITLVVLQVVQLMLAIFLTLLNYLRKAVLQT